MDAKCSTSITLIYQTIASYYQKVVMSHICVVMVIVGCIRQIHKELNRCSPWLLELKYKTKEAVQLHM